MRIFELFRGDVIRCTDHGPIARQRGDGVFAIITGLVNARDAMSSSLTCGRGGNRDPGMTAIMDGLMPR